MIKKIYRCYELEKTNVYVYECILFLFKHFKEILKSDAFF